MQRPYVRHGRGSKISGVTKRRVLGVYRLFFAALAGSALLTILSDSLGRENFNPVNFFSFFTVESNLLAAVVLLLSGLASLVLGESRQDEQGRFALLRGATTLYMTMTGIIYFLFLRGLEEALQLPIPWVNTVLHYVTPLAVLADWLFDPPRRAISSRESLVWVSFPALYVFYSLIRGATTGWYPYPFLNAAVRGYESIAVTCAVLLVAVIVLAVLLAARTRGRAREGR